jgi:hypothetical protein
MAVPLSAKDVPSLRATSRIQGRIATAESRGEKSN